MEEPVAFVTESYGNPATVEIYFLIFNSFKLS